MTAPTVFTPRPDQDQRRAISPILAPFGGITYLADAGEDPDARATMLNAARAIITLSPRRELSQHDLSALAGAEFIQLLSAGANHIDFAALPPQAKVAGNVGAYADPMAEHVVAMALALAKRLPQNHAKLASGVFDHFETLRLRGGTAGILGYGGIGKASARLFRAFGMRIHAINSSGRGDENADLTGTLADLGDLLASSDIVVVSLPLTRATRGLIGARELSLMKPEAILINVARGAILDEDALYEHLRAHPEFCAGIDTWWDEPRDGKPFHPGHPFFTLPNLLGSPHNSGTVAGIDAEAAATAARNVAAYLSGAPVRGIQDPADYQPT
ncbi:MAG TPA: 2-hydroxyacid dehydrogenase [Streptosporangiaceae bacterium]